VLKLGNSAELHNKPALIRVKVVPGQTKDDEPQNEVKGYKPIDGATPVAAVPPAAAGSPAAPTSSATPAAAAPAWAQKKAS
jgi:hypothetical protein